MLHQILKTYLYIIVTICFFVVPEQEFRFHISFLLHSEVQSMYTDIADGVSEVWVTFRIQCLMFAFLLSNLIKLRIIEQCCVET